jgi:hypothetical protein
MEIPSVPVSQLEAVLLPAPTPKTTNQSDFEPFYDRLALRLGNLLRVPRPLSKIVVAFGLGFTFFVLQWLSLGDRIYRNSGWMLAVLISCAVLFQYYATATFREALPEINARINEENAKSLIRYVNKVLSDWNFVRAGLLFGVLNAFMGFLFGLPSDYRGVWPAVTSYSGFFIAGFVCGIPVWGIYGVWRVFDAFAKEQNLRVSYTAHDDRGGMEFIGAALVRFAAVTLTEGVLIAWYIWHMQWSRSHDPYVNLVFIFWIAWPFILSTFALVAPCIRLHRRLETAKREEDDRLQEKMRDIESKVDTTAPAQMEALLKKHDYYKERRGALDRMRTWPYGNASKIKYGGIAVLDVIVAVKTVHEHYDALMRVRSLMKGLLS